MIYFKACPKCHGDLIKDKDIYGSFIKCLQCGYLRDLEVGGILPKKARERID